MLLLPTTRNPARPNRHWSEQQSSENRDEPKMHTSNPIRRVTVVRTGQVKIRPDHWASTWRPTPCGCRPPGFARSQTALQAVRATPEA